MSVCRWQIFACMCASVTVQLCVAVILWRCMMCTLPSEGVSFCLSAAAKSLLNKKADVKVRCFLSSAPSVNPLLLLCHKYWIKFNFELCYLGWSHIHLILHALESVLEFLRVRYLGLFLFTFHYSYGECHNIWPSNQMLWGTLLVFSHTS